MTEIKVNACANGKLCGCVYDFDDKTVTIFDRCGQALGYFYMSDLDNAIIDDASRSNDAINRFEKFRKNQKEGVENVDFG